MQTSPSFTHTPPSPPELERDWPILGIIGTLASWWRKQAIAHDAVSELAKCDDLEVQQMARDLGLQASELRSLAEYGPGGAERLNARLEALHLKLGSTERGVRRDLERLCTTCTCKTRCDHDLAHNPQGAAWKTYCPNAETLQELQASTEAH